MMTPECALQIRPRFPTLHYINQQRNRHKARAKAKALVLMKLLRNPEGHTYTGFVAIAVHQAKKPTGGNGSTCPALSVAALRSVRGIALFGTLSRNGIIS